NMALSCANVAWANPRTPPYHRRDVRLPSDHELQRRVRNEAHMAVCQRHEIVVHHMQIETLQVGNLARDMDGKDLTPSFPGCLRTDAEAFRQQAARGRPLAVPDDVLARPEHLEVDRQ